MQNETISVPALRFNPELSDISNYHSWGAMSLSCQEELEIAGQRLGILVAHRKRVEEQRDQVLKPLNEAAKQFRSMAARILDPIGLIERSIRDRVGKLMDARQRELDEAERVKREALAAEARTRANVAAEIAMSSGSMEAAQAANNWTRQAEKALEPVDVKQTMRLETGTIAQRKVWKWKITDSGKIPREYLVVDEKLLNRKARAYDADIQEPIPGIEFYSETSISVTA